MPPWHAAHGYGEFVGERRLTDAQIAAIAAWVKNGMPRGDDVEDAEAARVPRRRLAARAAGPGFSRCRQASSCRQAGPTSSGTS